jgi:hypothetical protein
MQHRAYIVPESREDRFWGLLQPLAEVYDVVVVDDYAASWMLLVRHWL